MVYRLPYFFTGRYLFLLNVEGFHIILYVLTSLFLNNVLMCGIFVFQLFYVNKFYIPTMLVPRTIPICAAWTDDLMKKRVHAELHDYGDFGLADVRDNFLSTFSFIFIFEK